MKLTEKVKGVMLCLNEGTEPLILHDEDNENTHYECGCSVAENDNGQVDYFICMSHVENHKLMKNFTSNDLNDFFNKPIVHAAVAVILIIIILFSGIF